MRRWLLVGLGVFSAALALAASPPTTYGQALLEELVRTNPDVLAATISAIPPKSAEPVIVASTDRATLGTRADTTVVAGTTITAAASASGERLVVRLPLNDVSGDAIGALSLTYAARDRAEAARAAERIRDRLHRRISHAGNLFDPFPYEPNAVLHTYAQRLVDEFVDKYPEIEILAIHATPPESDYNVIAGSNIGRIGKKADNDDMRCVFTGKPNLEVNSTGKRFETELQLHDHAGNVIGAVGIVVAYKNGDDKEALHAHADKIKVELEKRIPDSAGLFKPAS